MISFVYLFEGSLKNDVKLGIICKNEVILGVTEFLNEINGSF